MSVVENLHFDYGDFKLEIDRMEILDQGVTVLSGPSGSGKSSVLRHLMGLERAPQMRWIFNGEDLCQFSPSQRRLGVVFQSLELFPHMTAEENIRFAARCRKLPRELYLNKFSEFSEALGLASFLNRKAAVLSGGERQRVALARALIAKPRMLILDEPFSALDENLKSGARQLLRKLIQSEDIPALLVTHDPRDVEELADCKILIESGQIRQEKRRG